MKRLAQWSILVILICLTCSRAAFASDPMKTGKDALDRGDYLKAIEAFRDATQNDPKNGDAFYYLGLAYFKADSLDQAVPALVQGREVAPTNPRMFELLGDVYAKQRIYAGAIEEFKKAVQYDSTSAPLFLKLAEMNRKLRKYNDAATAYLRVIALDSNNVAALAPLGTMYVKASQWANALPVYLRLAKLQFDSMNVQSTYVRVLAENQFWKDLIPVGERVMEKDPSNAMVQTLLAEAYVKTGKSQQALDKYRRMDVATMRIEDLVSFARALKSVEQYDSTVIIYQLVLKRDSTRCDIPYDLGTALMKVKRYDAAVKMFERKIECDTLAGYRFASHLNAAMCLLQLKDFDQAKVHILKSIEIRPDNIQAWQTLAQCNLLLGNVDEGVDKYRKVIDLIGEDPEGKYASTLGEAYQTIGVQILIQAVKSKDEEAQKKMYQSAFENLKKALAFNPKNLCEVLLWAGQAAQNSNNKEEARKLYCKVLRQCATSKQAKDAQKGLESLNMKCEE